MSQDEAMNGPFEDYEMMGIAGEEDDDGMGKRNKAARKEKRKKKGGLFKKIAKFVKKSGLGPARSAFLLMVRVNLLKWATKLEKVWNKDSTKLKNFWTKLGGNPDKLKQAIAKGSKTQLSGMGDDGNFDGLGLVGEQMGVAPAAAAAAALPVIMAVLKFLKAAKLIDKKDAGELDQATSEVEAKAEESGGEKGGGGPSDDDGGDGGTKAGSMWFACWTNPVSASMNILKGMFYLGADVQLHGPFYKLYTLIQNLF